MVLGRKWNIPEHSFHPKSLWSCPELFQSIISIIKMYPVCGPYLAAAAAAKSLQSCLTLCDPRDGSLPGSPVPGILQARTLEWVPIAFSNAWKWKVKVKSLSRVWLFMTPWTAAHQAPPSLGLESHLILMLYSILLCGYIIQLFN